MYKSKMSSHRRIKPLLLLLHQRRRWGFFLESSSFPHINNTPDTVALLHIRKGLVDAVQRLSVRDELVDFEFSGHIVVDEVGQLGPALDAAERAAFPYAARDKLER